MPPEPGAFAQLPWLGAAETKVRPAGSVSVIVALVAVEGPVLRTLIRKPPSVVALMVPVNADLSTRSVALGLVPAEASEKSLRWAASEFGCPPPVVMSAALVTGWPAVKFATT